MNWFFTALNVIIIGMLGYIVYQQNIELTYYDSMNEPAPIVVAESTPAETPATATVNDAEKPAVTDDNESTTSEDVESDEAQIKEEEVTTPAVTEEPAADDEIIRPSDDE